MTTGISLCRPGAGPGEDRLADAAIWRSSQVNETPGGLCTWVCYASGGGRRARGAADRLRVRARQKPGTWRTARLAPPGRRGWLPLTTLIALAMLALDASAAYVAVEALSGDRRVTLLWAVPFLVILGLLEAGLAWSAEPHAKLFSLIAAGRVAFAVSLVLLRFGFVAAAGTGLLAAAAGAAVFTACMVTSVADGFAAIRYARMLTIWRMRPTLPGHTAAINDIETKVRAHLPGEPS